jgi:hypothetical protein
MQRCSGATRPSNDRGVGCWESDSHVGFLGELDVDLALSLLHDVLVLDSHDTTTPGLAELVVVVELGLEVLAELFDIGEVFGVHSGESDAGGGLAVNELSEGSLSADEAEGDALLAAESWEMDDNLNWVNVVGDDNELGAALLNKSGDVVETELEVLWSGRLLGATGLSFLLETLFLFLAGFWHVLSQQFKKLGGYRSN